MAAAIDATAGGASANSYATVAELVAYMEGRLNASLFDDADADKRIRALIEAAREIDVRAFSGTRVTGTQALSWPRQWAVDPDSPIQDYYGTTTVPQRIKDGQMELAFQFIKAGTTDLAAEDADANDGVTEKKIDVLTTKFSPYNRKKGLKRYPRVWDRIAPLLDHTATGTQLVRG